MNHILKSLLLLVAICYANVLLAQDLKISSLGLGFYGLTDQQNNEVVKRKYHKIYDAPKAGYFIAEDKNHKVELLHRQTGKIIKKGKGLTMLPQGYAGSDFMVLGKNGKYALYNFDFQQFSKEYYQIKISYHYPQYVLFFENTDWGLMNGKAEILIPAQYMTMDFGQLKDDGIFHPTPYLFRVSRPNQQTIYVDSTNTMDIAATAANCCYRGGGLGADYLAQRAFLLQNLDKLKGVGKTAIAKTYHTTHDSINNLAEAYKWYKLGWEEAPTSLYAGLSLAEFLQAKTQFRDLDASLSFAQLFRAVADMMPYYNIEIAALFMKNNPDSARFYYEKAISKTKFNSYAHLYANIGLAKLHYANGDKTLAASHLLKAKSAAAANHTQVYAHQVEELAGMKLAADVLQYGQVVLFNGKKAMVLHTSLNGRNLSNGDVIPSTATNFKILNESNAQFFTRCPECAGTGTVTKTIKSPYTYSYSISEKHTGSSVSGDYIKTTTYTPPSTYKGEVTCGRCYGTKKVVKK